MNEFFSWAGLATFAGASAATGIITQFLKEKIKKLPTQWLSYIIAVVVLALATAATAWGADWTTWAMIPLNAVVVSLASNGAYSASIRIRDGQSTD